MGAVGVGVAGAAGLALAGCVGPGFPQQPQRMMAARPGPLRRGSAPFGSTIPPEQARGAVWAEPQVVIEAEFALWTSAGRLRAASFRGLRVDKAPTDVVRELVGGQENAEGHA